MQVGRQRHLAVTLERPHRTPRKLEHPEVVLAAHDPGLEAVGEEDAAAGRGRLARAQLDQRPLTGDHALEQYLDAPAGFLAAVEPRGDHARVVEYQQVTRAQQGRQVGEAAVGQPPARPVEVQQATVAAPRRRMPRDQFVGKLVVKVAAAHGPRMLAEALRSAPRPAGAFR